MSTPKLNIAGRLAQTFITSKLTIVFIIGVALMGVIAILQTPREENPRSSFRVRWSPSCFPAPPPPRSNP